MSEFTPVFGIDLGTTFSAISYIDEFERPVVINNKNNTPITPSVIHFMENGEFVVGQIASNYLKIDPANTVDFIKRKMGHEDCSWSIRGNSYSPQHISALILKDLVKSAERYFEEQGKEVCVKDVVITVPAYFGMQQRGATKEAGELAGLNVLMILNEPTAAALAYGINRRDTNQTVFIFDLGGGTFDVTILKIEQNSITMLASDGFAELGGKDWDDSLLNYCADKFVKSYGSDPRDDPKDYQELYDRVVRAKITLSEMPKVDIQITHAGHSESYSIDRELFQTICDAQLKQCSFCCDAVLRKANMAWADIDEVLLVGGSTYMPMVRDLVKKISGKTPSTKVNPDLCVAIGAAYQARFRFIAEMIEKIRITDGDRAADDAANTSGISKPIKVVECVAKSLGVITHDADLKEFVFEMIPEQKIIPFKKSDEFYYIEDRQTGVKVEITEGQGQIRDDVTVIGVVELKNLPARKKGDKLTIEYNYNQNKILEVVVVDLETGLRQQGSVVLEGSMTKEEMDRAKEHIGIMKNVG